jgi:N6-adenosine-specific RNA methylase IME4
LEISKTGTGESYGSADAHYPQMSIDELCLLPIKEIADDNAILFLWTTSPLLEDTFKIIKTSQVLLIILLNFL